MPEEAIQAAVDLGARALLPVHWAKFSLSLHAWNEPIMRATKAAATQPVILFTSMIGQKVFLDRCNEFTEWWT